jgi:hypothetical protein
MNFIQRRRFKRHPDQLVRLAMEHSDRPTDLKQAILALDFDFENLLSITQSALEVYSKYPPIQDDLRLACLRANCSIDPGHYSQILLTFPELERDERAIRSLEFYKQKRVDTILGIEFSEEEPEVYEELIRTTRLKGIFDWGGFMDSDLSKQIIDAKLHAELIDQSLTFDRTLNQLKTSVTKRLNNPKDPLSIEDLIGIVVFVIGQQKSVRSYSDLFVASLRAIGEKDGEDAIRFGNLFIPFISDHRALRSQTVYLRRAGMFDEAIRLLHHPNFVHDQQTQKWLKNMVLKKRHHILDGNFRPTFESYGDDYGALSSYIDEIFLTLKDDIHVAQFVYSYIRELYEITDNSTLANELIRWGEAINSLNMNTSNNTTLGGDLRTNPSENPKSYNRLLRELRRLEDSVSLRLGNHITRAIRNPLHLVVLPFTLPSLIIKLGLQRIGKTPSQSKQIAISEKAPRKNSIVLFPTNGVGFGHFTRMYAVARALRKADPELEIVFFTPMPTLHILYSDNFPTYHIAGRYKHSNMTARQWNGLIEEMLTLIFEMHSPKWFMFDGAFPYRGMLNAIQAQYDMDKYWMHRGTLKKNKNVPQGTIELFDTIVRPQDINQMMPNRINLLTEEVFVPPITLIEPHEMLEREQARATLSVPQDCKLVYVQLGAGRINEISSTVRIVIDELLTEPNIHVVLGESLLGERTMLALERLHIIRDYPNALFLKAFDASVQAGGYNSFHEMRSIRMPTLFIPNTHTGMDDQYKRVMLSVDEGWGLVIKPVAKEISKGIQTLLSLKPSAYESMPNGATETAKHILKL